ncbi:hypothetical protein LV779_29900 [Streptomyces thinghirensis]|nr:hypothetical protein [Streptomyces thinghirensis]
MTQSGQGEEPSARQAHEGIVLPSDGGEPLPRARPADPPAPRRVGPSRLGAARRPGLGRAVGPRAAAEPGPGPGRPGAGPRRPAPSPGGPGDRPVGRPAARLACLARAGARHRHPAPCRPGRSPGPLPGGRAGPGVRRTGRRPGVRIAAVVRAARPARPGARAPAVRAPAPGVSSRTRRRRPSRTRRTSPRSRRPPTLGATQYLPPVGIPADEGATQYIPPWPRERCLRRDPPSRTPSRRSTSAGHRSTRAVHGRLPAPPRRAPPRRRGHAVHRARARRPRPGPYGAAPGSDEGRRPPAEFDSLSRSAPGADGPASATQQLPTFDEPQHPRPGDQPAYARRAGRRRWQATRARRRGRPGWRGERTSSRLPLLAAVGVGIAVVGVGAGAMMAGGGGEEDEGGNQTVSATAPVSSPRRPPPRRPSTRSGSRPSNWTSCWPRRHRPDHGDQRRRRREVLRQPAQGGQDLREAAKQHTGWSPASPSCPWTSCRSTPS